MLTGDPSGTTGLVERLVIHANGKVTATAVETFTGTPNGDSRTLTFRDVVHADTAAGTVEGHFAVAEGTEELADAHGQGTFSGRLATDIGMYTALLK